jgi:NADPH-dependent 7-cyano-7-deazaguanine reductase QueF
MLPKTLPNTARVDDILYQTKAQFICISGPSVVNVQIQYNPKDLLIEFLSFDEWIRTWSGEHMTLEDATRRVFDMMELLVEPVWMRVVLEGSAVQHGAAQATITSR